MLRPVYGLGPVLAWSVHREHPTRTGDAVTLVGLLYLPAAHPTQVVAPVADWYWPTAQFVYALVLAPVSTRNIPVMQPLHIKTPVLVWYRPTAHLTYSAAPPLMAYIPAEHAMYDIAEVAPSRRPT